MANELDCGNLLVPRTRLEVPVSPTWSLHRLYPPFWGNIITHWNYLVYDKIIAIALFILVCHPGMSVRGMPGTYLSIPPVDIPVPAKGIANRLPANGPEHIYIPIWLEERCPMGIVSLTFVPSTSASSNDLLAWGGGGSILKSPCNDMGCLVL